MPPSARALLIAISCAALCACPAPPVSFRVVDLDEAKRLVETREVVLVEAPELATSAPSVGEPTPPGAAVLVFGVSEAATRARAAALARAGNRPVLVFVPRDADERGRFYAVASPAKEDPRGEDS
ncbi:MAG: hypothetical protein FJ108_07665 [Deltaproteobacteria bacterium]|nr:hypothetical protein [Deltaproteobacteria bacterium]